MTLYHFWCSMTTHYLITDKKIFLSIMCGCSRRSLIYSKSDFILSHRKIIRLSCWLVQAVIPWLEFRGVDTQPVVIFPGRPWYSAKPPFVAIHTMYISMILHITINYNSFSTATSFTWMRKCKLLESVFSRNSCKGL